MWSLVPFAFGGPQWDKWENGEQGLDWETVVPLPVSGHRLFGKQAGLLSLRPPRHLRAGELDSHRSCVDWQVGEEGQRSWV